LLLACLLTLTNSAVADEDPVLNLYNWSDYMGPDTVSGFEAETGIHVNYDVYDSTTVVEAKLLAGQTGYDVVLEAARYSARMIPLGVFRELDKSKLPGMDKLDPWVMQMLRQYDPGNRYTMPFMWGTTGFIYNERMIRERMPDAPVDSAAMLFDPQVASRFADCGISLLESSTMVIPMALLYLGHDPNSMDPALLAEAEAQLKQVRPFIRYISSARMLVDMPGENICIAMAWSGDIRPARQAVEEAGADVQLAYSVPREGTVLWFDTWVIPADAPHPGNALRFLAYLLRPEVIAPISETIGYGNANLASLPLLDPDFASDPAAYPPPEVRERGHPIFIHEPKAERLRSRAWARFKSDL